MSSPFGDGRQSFCKSLVLNGMDNYLHRLRVVIFVCCAVWARVGFALCVTSEKANLRAQPSSKAPLSWTVGRFMPLLEIEKKGAWYQVEDLDGERHWIHQGLVSKQIKCLAVKSSKAALRTGPGTGNPYASPAFVGKYYSFRRIEFSPPWYQVSDPDGDQFWVHENLVWAPLKRVKMSF